MQKNFDAEQNKVRQVDEITEVISILPLLLSIPPTANIIPTVDLRGLVLGLWNDDRLSGNR